MAQLVLTSVVLFCAFSSSLSNGQGDGPGLHAWDLLLWVGISIFVAPTLSVWKFDWGFPDVLLVSLPLV